MDVDDQVMDLTTHRENQESPVKQSERKKKKSHGNRKLQRYRRNLRKRGQILETIASLSAASVDQNVLATPKGNIDSKRSEKSLDLILSICLRSR